MAFTAYADATRTYGEAQTVIFNRIQSSFGDAYEPVSSMFTCPVTGVYVIYLTVTSSVGNEFQALIYHEVSYSMAVWPDNDVDTRNTGSSTVVRDCDAGQRIWIRSQINGEMYGHPYGNRLSSFSVFLLYAY